MIEFQEQEIGLRALVKEISEQIDRVQKQKEKFETFAETAGNHERTGQESADPAELEARYYALTKEISDSVDELRKAQNDWIGRIQGKKKDIQKPKVVLKQNIYTRINDTNTPINRTADVDKIEYLWRKRFGIHLSVEEKVKLYLSDIENWVYDDERAILYYRMEPMFTIEIKRVDYEEKKCQSKRSEFYDQLMIKKGDGFTWEEFEIKYANIVIYTHWVDYLDGGRYMIAVPQHKIISNKSVRRDEMYGIYYYDNSNFQGLVNKILIEHYPGDSREILKSIFNDFIIEFNSGTELKKFVNFLDKNVELLKNDKIFPKLVLDRKYEMEDFDAIEYVVAKKIKWLYENRYLKLE